MLFTKRKTKNKLQLQPIILILEDDVDQMAMLTNCAHKAIAGLSGEADEVGSQAGELSQIEIVGVSDIESLTEAVLTHENVLLALLDCNTPDTAKGTPHDQFVKVNHVISGQHKAVDIVRENLPNTPITIISAMGRFQRIVSKYYAEQTDLQIGFISKSDPLAIRRNINQHIA